jgi:1,6-anhydro-N-acetylmuramate kinase
VQWAMGLMSGTSADGVDTALVEGQEAILFALLAYAVVHGRPGHVPGATGARRAVVLGKIVPA